MLKYKLLIFTFFTLYILRYENVTAQASVSDSSILMPLVKLGYSVSIPGGDLKNSFGVTSTLNTRFEVKFRNQWIVGAKYDFFFGSNYKDSGMLQDLLTSSGGIINDRGEFGTYEMLQRGHHLGIYVGRLFSVFSPNPNSGIVTTLGAGIIAHRVNFNNISGDLLQLNGEYAKGYDRYTSGISFTEFIGYRYMSNNRLMNFYGGIEFTQAFTKIRRDYQVDYAVNDSRFGQRRDLLYSIQIGWILPLYKRAPKDFYY